MIEWIRPSGSKIKTADNDANIAFAVSQGWTLVSEVDEPVVTVSPIEVLINEMTDKEAVIEYAASLGCEIDKRGGLDKIKEKAIKAIGELDGDSIRGDQ